MKAGSTKTLYLHIGAHKTGSTAIQGMLIKKSSELAAAGYTVLNHKGERNLYNLVHELNGCTQFSPSGTRWGEVSDRIHSEEGSFILSCEGLSRFSRSKIDQVKNHTGDIPTTIILYTRRQDKYLQSLYTQRVKRGYTAASFGTFVKQNLDKPSLDWRSLATAWSAVFGRENIRVVDYDAASLAETSLTANFLTHMGLPEHIGEGVDRIINRSPSARQLIATRFITKGLSSLGKTQAEIEPLLKKLPSFGSRPFRGLTPKMSKEILSHWEEPNERLKKDFPQGQLTAGASDPF